MGPIGAEITPDNANALFGEAKQSPAAPLRRARSQS